MYSVTALITASVSISVKMSIGLSISNFKVLFATALGFPSTSTLTLQATCELVVSVLFVVVKTVEIDPSHSSLIVATEGIKERGSFWIVLFPISVATMGGACFLLLSLSAIYCYIVSFFIARFSVINIGNSFFYS